MKRGANKVVDIDRGYARMRLDVKNVKGAYVKVGVQEDTKRSNLDGVTDMVVVAAAHEFGTATIDERSFIRSTRDANAKEIDRLIAAEAKAILEGRKTKEESLNGLGLWLVGKIQDRIHSNIPPPLAESTIRRKQSSVALIDSGQLVQGIRHVVGTDYRPGRAAA